jgi:hypothetical protein
LRLMKSNLKLIRRPKVRKRGWRLETSKGGWRRGEPKKGLGGCRKGQEVEDERNENKKK